MSRPIFLSYRRSDSGSASLRLYEAIRRRFGAESIYMDTASTAWGEEWPSALEDAISSADVVIVVIGRGWITAQGEWGRRRIDQPDDWVRREIELALGFEKPTLPVLVGDAVMPPSEALPSAIASLASRQALSLGEEDWDAHVGALLMQLESRMSESHRGAVAARGEPPGETSIRSQFQAVTSRFYGSPIDERRAAAEEIANLGGLLPFDEVLAFAESKESAERVGAAIALAAHLQTSERVRDDADLQSALRKLLNDEHSRVR
jgi:TIR domain